MKRTLDIAIGPGSPVEWGRQLPDGYRPHDSERVVELPLALAVSVWSPLVLDAGAALNYAKTHTWIPSRLVHVTLGHEPVYANPRRQYVKADLRRLPFATRQFPCVVCVSTLEHIGMDNRHYGHLEASAGSVTVWKAVRELRRVASGAIFVTVPCGRPEVHPSGQWRAFGLEDVTTLRALLGPGRVETRYYAKTASGWRMEDEGITDRRAWVDQKTVVGMVAMRAMVA